jgi:hypothetical protein
LDSNWVSEEKSYLMVANSINLRGRDRVQLELEVVSDRCPEAGKDYLIDTD